MTFTDRVLSKRLVKMGCLKPASKWEFYWIQRLRDKKWIVDYANATFMRYYHSEAIPAFTIEDFVGTHVQAKENARLIFGDESFKFGEYGDGRPSFIFHRHVMTDSASWLTYLREAVERK